MKVTDNFPGGQRYGAFVVAHPSPRRLIIAVLLADLSTRSEGRDELTSCTATAPPTAGTPASFAVKLTVLRPWLWSPVVLNDEPTWVRSVSTAMTEEFGACASIRTRRLCLRPPDESPTVAVYEMGLAKSSEAMERNMTLVSDTLGESRDATTVILKPHRFQTGTHNDPGQIGATRFELATSTSRTLCG